MEKNNNTSPLDENKDLKKTRCRTLVIEGTRYRTYLTPKFESRDKWITPDDKLITSIIPGTVVTVLVRKGQKVKEGDSLLVLESMKMQNKILCPRNAVVKTIKVAAGQVIPKGYVMMELD
ncbi:MAG: acetyl-CoA carboxylase biotin carboxyl carrier protein subunit [Bacteroidales bacterium]